MKTVFITNRLYSAGNPYARKASAGQVATIRRIFAPCDRERTTLRGTCHTRLAPRFRHSLRKHQIDVVLKTLGCSFKGLSIKNALVAMLFFSKYTKVKLVICF